MIITIQVQFKCMWHGGLVFVEQKIDTDTVTNHYINADDFRTCESCRQRLYRANSFQAKSHP